MCKKFLLGAVAAAVIAPFNAHAFEWKISGQVNQAVLFGGDVDDATIVDNNASGSRFRIRGSKEISPGLKAGFRYEFQDQDNNSANLSDRENTDVRYSDIYLSGSFGKFHLGKGDGAANSTLEAYGLIHYFGGSEANQLFQGATDLAYRNVDGASRQNRLRYDSPTFNGLKLAFSLDNGDQTELAAYYKNKVLGGKLDARVGLVSADTDAGNSLDRTSYSIAYKHNIGLSGSYSYGERDFGDDGTTRETDWVMVGYSFGKTTVAYGTGQSGTNTMGITDDEMNVLSLNYKPTKGMEIYLLRMDFENEDGVDGDAFALGSRIKF